MNLKGMKNLLLLILSILLWTVSYSQNILKNDSIVCLSLNEAKYFINQNTKAEYYEEDNKQLIKKDSLNIQEIENLRNISNIHDSIFAIQKQRIETNKSLLDDSKKNINKLNLLLNKKEDKIRVRNTILSYSLIVIVLETILLSIVLQ